jgi:hypothetical protein
LANLVLFVSILISDDLPTLLLPINAYSGRSGAGQAEKSGLLMRYFEVVIIIPPVPLKGEPR